MSNHSDHTTPVTDDLEKVAADAPGQHETDKAKKTKPVETMQHSPSSRAASTHHLPQKHLDPTRRSSGPTITPSDPATPSPLRQVHGPSDPSTEAWRNFAQQNAKKSEKSRVAPSEGSVKAWKDFAAQHAKKAAESRNRTLAAITSGLLRENAYLPRTKPTYSSSLPLSVTTSAQPLSGAHKVPQPRAQEKGESAAGKEVRHLTSTKTTDAQAASPVEPLASVEEEVDRALADLRLNAPRLDSRFVSSRSPTFKATYSGLPSTANVSPVGNMGRVHDTSQRPIGFELATKTKPTAPSMKWRPQFLARNLRVQHSLDSGFDIVSKAELDDDFAVIKGVVPSAPNGKGNAGETVSDLDFAFGPTLHGLSTWEDEEDEEEWEKVWDEGGLETPMVRAGIGGKSPKPRKEVRFDEGQ